MKKALEYFREACEAFNNRSNKDTNIYDESFFIQAIKLAQEDAIRETVKECANNAEINFNTNDEEFISDTDFSFRDGNGNWCKISINENKIYSVADKLIKEL